MSAIERLEGTALPLRGDDIDTDRIIPARFLVSVTFEGLGEHVLKDDRAAAKAKGTPHPFDDPRFRGATVLLVGRNFGCGSSREHAPQAIHRRGFAAVIGESFSEIFFGNSLAIGLPCVRLPHDAMAELMGIVEKAPATRVVIDLKSESVALGERSFTLSIPENAREALLTGRWDGTSMLLERYAEVESVAARLPYVRGF
jgi:3-isopropylmalate/(R)-2-methylmalate dehydratase small subunit